MRSPRSVGQQAPKEQTETAADEQHGGGDGQHGLPTLAAVGLGPGVVVRAAERIAHTPE